MTKNNLFFMAALISICSPLCYGSEIDQSTHSDGSDSIHESEIDIFPLTLQDNSTGESRTFYFCSADGRQEYCHNLHRQILMQEVDEYIAQNLSQDKKDEHIVQY